MLRAVLPVHSLLHVPEEGGRGALLHFPARRSADGDVRGDEADDLLGAVLRRQALEYAVGVLCITDLERTVRFLRPGPVEVEHTAGALERPEAGNPVSELA